ncbi:NAD(P)/FAD-dependent oxidoreductase [Lacrimispora sp. NSJ-141]|uniref:NAD(P)/FAD-dependent oxidoreductase n=1 Tax=Lientehia hominis TaxID=2897778 RepID=A0AAP2RJ95_9FIRM|nr:NAD(P)/FAD-dependent oxidoreductase [Lientehia hominis]MCD2492997.1 NAD(P)/FAD-dependent oxidoreductase [Lientehia hominis]
MYDVLIIGTGIVGCFLAHELSHYELSSAAVDRENDVACGATMANSAIIHAGNDPEDGTLKARLNLEGARQYEDICNNLHVPYEKVGSFTAAAGEEEEKTLFELYRKAKERGISASILDGAEARKMEPLLSSHVTKVLALPDTAVVCPWETAEALMEEAVLNGTELLLNHQVTGIERMEENGSRFRVHMEIHRGGKENGNIEKAVVEAKVILNAAGVFCDDIYGLVCPERTLKGDSEIRMKIGPRRGEYFVLDRQEKPAVSRVLYPVPGKTGKGVLAVPTVHGNVLLGPDSRDTSDKEGIDNTAEGLEYVKEQIGKVLETVPWLKIIRSFAGLRAKGNTGDFIIEESPEVPGFINVAGIESPGLSSAPAIASYVRKDILKERMFGEGFTWRKKVEYQRRKPPVIMERLSREEKNRMIAANPTYGKIVCRCERISEGEIIDSIRKPVGARSIKGVKKRVRPGMGRCQGGFCEPEIVRILARELGIREEEVVYDREGVRLFEAMEKSLTEGRRTDEAL